jgi:glycosyltransferase involved in cell wall biosynthesis
LYDWIGTISTDTVIYRFYPHGSRNLTDFRSANSAHTQRPWRHRVRQVPVICHDQEPLDWARYDIPWDKLRDICVPNWPLMTSWKHLENVPEFWQRLASRNLNAVTHLSINDASVLLHSELNSTEVQRYQDAGFVPVYWFAHAIIARDWYRFAKNDNNCENYPPRFDKDYNIYCRAWSGTREYRLKFLSLLEHYGVKDCSRVTFGHHDDGTHYRDFVAVNPALAINADLPFENSDVTSDASATYSSDHYHGCAIDVVLETMFDDTRWHLTEKILRPIACGKPFILASTPGALSYLKRYGFATFNTCIDESYDNIKDPVKRLEAIAEVMRDISQQTEDDRITLFKRMHDIAAFNREHFFSEKFANQVVRELEEGVTNAVAHIRESAQGLDYKWLLAREDPVTDKNLLDVTADRTNSDVESLLIEIGVLDQPQDEITIDLQEQKKSVKTQ